MEYKTKCNVYLLYYTSVITNPLHGSLLPYLEFHETFFSFYSGFHFSCHFALSKKAYQAKSNTQPETEINTTLTKDSNKKSSKAHKRKTDSICSKRKRDNAVWFISSGHTTTLWRLLFSSHVPKYVFYRNWYTRMSHCLCADKINWK